MNPPCARCKKTVYPVEKLNCLDKVWHKGCFNCEVCNLKLTMKTYKGYNKLPYCNTHYPSTKFTAVADTPENLRLKSQTQNQSQVVYQAQFKDSLKQFHSVATDPETTRARNVQRNVSGAVYTADHQEEQRRPSYGSSAASAAVGMPPAQHAAPVAVAPPPVAAAPPSGPRRRALYDYTAADEDEASFQEGDIVLNVEVIDEGWISGTVERSGSSGMMPRNYFEEV